MQVSRAKKLVLVPRNIGGTKYTGTGACLLPTDYWLWLPFNATGNKISAWFHFRELEKELDRKTQRKFKSTFYSDSNRNISVELGRYVICWYHKLWMFTCCHCCHVESWQCLKRKKRKVSKASKCFFENVLIIDLNVKLIFAARAAQ